MNKKLILFDLDGVLLDSKSNMEIAWKAVCDKHVIVVKFEDYFSHIGRPFNDILSILGITKGHTAIQQTFHDTSLALLDQTKFYSNVITTLQILLKKDIKLGIVTSKDHDRTHKISQKLPIHFSIIQTPNTKLQGKPAPDHLLYAMQTLNINPDNTLYIGDMDVDYQTAKAANVDYAHATWGYGYCHDENIVKLSDITQLLSIIK